MSYLTYVITNSYEFRSRMLESESFLSFRILNKYTYQISNKYYQNNADNNEYIASNKSKIKMMYLVSDHMVFLRYIKTRDYNIEFYTILIEKKNIFRNNQDYYKNIAYCLSYCFAVNNFDLLDKFIKNYYDIKILERICQELSIISCLTLEYVIKYIEKNSFLNQDIILKYKNINIKSETTINYFCKYLMGRVLHKTTLTTDKLGYDEFDYLMFMKILTTKIWCGKRTNLIKYIKYAIFEKVSASYKKAIIDVINYIFSPSQYNEFIKYRDPNHDIIWNEDKIYKKKYDILNFFSIKYILKLNSIFFKLSDINCLSPKSIKILDIQCSVAVFLYFASSARLSNELDCIISNIYGLETCIYEFLSEYINISNYEKYCSINCKKYSQSELNYFKGCFEKNYGLKKMIF